VVSFIDLKSQFERIQTEIEARVLSVLRGGQYILGPEVGALEEQLAKFVGVEHVVTCSSGTDALIIALMAEGIGPGDAVFTTPFTFIATAEAIALLGATPIFVDIDPSTFNIDAQKLADAIDAIKYTNMSCLSLPKWPEKKLQVLNPKGIIAVDLFGLPACYEKVNAIAEEHGLFVIEDAAQSFGASANGVKAGKLAATGCTSFFPAKPLGGYGDGGALFTADKEKAELYRSLRVHGQGDNKYENVRLGVTGRLDEIQAAILLPKLEIFSEELADRQRVAATYSKLIDESGLDLITPSIPNGYVSAWAQYSLLSKDSDARQVFQDRLNAKGIPSMIYYPKPLHLQKAFENLSYKKGDFPESERASERIFSLPMHPYLTDENVAEIVDALKGA
jgi:UDP-2-acetamido-2-deoxy-ribo-hexuluronate aminotransferase